MPGGGARPAALARGPAPCYDRDMPPSAPPRLARLALAATLVHLAFDTVGRAFTATTPPYLLLPYMSEIFRDMLGLLGVDVISVLTCAINGLIAGVFATALFEAGRRRRALGLLLAGILAPHLRRHVHPLPVGPLARGHRQHGVRPAARGRAGLGPRADDGARVGRPADARRAVGPGPKARPLPFLARAGRCPTSGAQLFRRCKVFAKGIKECFMIGASPVNHPRPGSAAGAAA